MTKTIHFTLVSTIFNEAARLPQTISDLEAQTLKPSEIVITDAGSTDATWQILEEWKQQSSIPIVLLQEKGCNVARGRNLAIEAASHDLIVSTDFGCRFHPGWLESITEPFLPHQNTSSVAVVGGAFAVLEEDIQTLAARSDYILQKGYPVVMDQYFSVSSRSIAYKKEVWQKIGGYPEWLTLAADDTIFWKLIKKEQFNYVFIEQPLVYWGRHKTNKAFAREAFRYGLGDGESRINYRNFWSNIIETGMRYALFLLLLIMPVLIISGIVPVISCLILLLFLPGLRSYKNAWKNWQVVKSSKYNVKAFINALIQLEQSRIQYIKGYTKGIKDNDPIKKAGREKLTAILNS
jgi:glycosyltransferase involved in cell wall biosynthesis